MKGEEKTGDISAFHAALCLFLEGTGTRQMSALIIERSKHYLFTQLRTHTTALAFLLDAGKIISVKTIKRFRHE